MLEVLLFAREARLYQPDAGVSRINIVPLFEALDAAAQGHGHPRRAHRAPGVPPAPGAARRPAGGDDRLLGQQQGVAGSCSRRGRCTRCSAALAGHGPAGGGAGAGVPRPGRGGRAGRRAGEQGDPGPAPRQRQRPAQDHRAGGDDRRPLRHPGHRPPPPRPGRQRRPAGQPGGDAEAVDPGVGAGRRRHRRAAAAASTAPSSTTTPGSSTTSRARRPSPRCPS